MPLDRRKFIVGGAAAGGTALVAGCTSADDGTASTTTAETSGATSPPPVPAELADTELPEAPEQPLRVIIDSDAANEIDDQFALAWALMAPEALQIEAITAAPFSFGDYLAGLLAAQEARGEGPATPFEELAVTTGSEGIEKLRSDAGAGAGMSASLAEIERVLDAAAPVNRPPAVPGSESFLPSVTEPVPSAAATAIIEAAHAGDTPLYVPVLGAATNVASALLEDPTIADRIVVVFVAGFPSASPQVDESFNLLGDVNASRVLFAKAPKLLYIPGYGVSETLTTPKVEVDAYLAGRGALGDLLAELMARKVAPDGRTVPGNRRVMWDMAPIAWLIDQGWLSTFRTGRGTIRDDHRWEPAPGEMTEAFQIDDVAVFTDFFARFDPDRG